MTRIDSLLFELQSRHRNQDPRFLAAVRPLVEKILDPTLPEPARIPLMEMLAETFERDVQVRTDLAKTREGLAAVFDHLKRLLGLQ